MADADGEVTFAEQHSEPTLVIRLNLSSGFQVDRDSGVRTGFVTAVAAIHDGYPASVEVTRTLETAVYELGDVDRRNIAADAVNALLIKLGTAHV